MHWVHGIGMGAILGILNYAALRGPAASAAHFALLWGGDAALYRLLSVADVPWRWSASELGTDMLHKGVYAIAAGATYDGLTRTRPALRT